MRDADGFVRALDDTIVTELTNDFWTITLPANLNSSSARNPKLFAYVAAQNRLGAPVLFSHKKVGELIDQRQRIFRFQVMVDRRVRSGIRVAVKAPGVASVRYLPRYVQWRSKCCNSGQAGFHRPTSSVMFRYVSTSTRPLSRPRQRSSSDIGAGSLATRS